MTTLKVTTTENGEVIALPKGILAKLGLKNGDRLVIDETTEGLTFRSESVEEIQLSILNKIVTDDGDLLRRLAE
jgi:bifunctional DNA-binding transcriptional regulator/antitoxin component of YhaV-PrlF toxin-antitoxin module